MERWIKAQGLDPGITSKQYIMLLGMNLCVPDRKPKLTSNGNACQHVCCLEMRTPCFLVLGPLGKEKQTFRCSLSTARPLSIFWAQPLPILNNFEFVIFS